MLYTGTIHEPYSSYNASDALTALDDLYSRFINLKDLPVNHQVLPSYDNQVCSPPTFCPCCLANISKPETPKFSKTKAALFQYGWPDNFRQDDFVRDIEGLQEVWERKEHQEAKAKRQNEATKRKLQHLDVEDASGKYYSFCLNLSWNA